MDGTVVGYEFATPSVSSPCFEEYQVRAAYGILWQFLDDGGYQGRQL
jgi:hypothetical protein